MKKLYTLLLTGLLMASGSVFAQNHEKCAAHALREQAKQNDPSIALREAAFEALQAANAQNAVPTKGAIITIPIVFHIIHNGEPVGTGANVSDAIVMYQLQRINEDFRALNADKLTAGNPFFPDQADCEIQFCLATVDDNGDATTGITRHNMGAPSFTIQQIDNTIKPQTIWDRYSYINFWCVNIVDPSAPTVDGYGTFPDATSDTTDGVVVIPSSFGYVDGTDKSITATHELGHYFNLRHIWGDATCGDDMVSDTPTQEGPTSGCPTIPANVASPCNPGPNGEMFMNFMDYSDAECVVMFSNGQKARVLSAISTYRSGLTTSDGCQSTASIKEVDFANAFVVYPNPTNGNFTVDLKNADITNLTLKVYDQVGKEVTRVNNITNFPLQVNMKDFQEGVYFLQLNNENNTTTMKVSLVK